MSARRQDSDGNPLHRTTTRPRDQTPNREPNEHEKEHRKQDEYKQRIYHMVQSLAEWDDGYFKMRRGSDRSQVHLTWTWTLGRHIGCYVYVCVNFWELDYGLDLLGIKIFEVQEGLRKPTPDKRSSWRDITLGHEPPPQS